MRWRGSEKDGREAARGDYHGDTEDTELAVRLTVSVPSVSPWFESRFARENFNLTSHCGSFFPDQGQHELAPVRRGAML
jgi:hypothetical protein